MFVVEIFEIQKKKKVLYPERERERERERVRRDCLSVWRSLCTHGESDEKQREGGLECRHGEAHRSIHQKT